MSNAALNPRPLIGARSTIAGDPRFSLTNVNTFAIPDGTLCWVLGTKQMFALDKASTATADGVFIVQPSAGPGRWIAVRPDPESIGAQMNNIGTPTSIPGTNTLTPLTFSTTAYSSPASFADPANNRFVVPEAGIYEVTLWGLFSGGVPVIDRGNGIVPSLAILVAAATEADLHADFLSGTVHTILQLPQGALITAAAAQGTGADPALNMIARMSVQKIGS